MKEDLLIRKIRIATNGELCDSVIEELIESLDFDLYYNQRQRLLVSNEGIMADVTVMFPLHSGFGSSADGIWFLFNGRSLTVNGVDIVC